MAEPIEVIAVPVKIIAEPIEDRLVRISPMPADAQDRDVKCDQRVNESGELKSSIRGGEDDQAADSGKNFQPPSESIVRIDPRPNENNRDGNQQRDVRFFHRKKLIRKSGKQERETRFNRRKQS